MGAPILHERDWQIFLKILSAGVKLFKCRRGCSHSSIWYMQDWPLSSRVSYCAIFERGCLVKNLFRLGFADLYHGSYALKDFRVMADQAIISFYGIQHNITVCLNYIEIAHELDTLVERAGRGVSVTTANKDLQTSPHFRCIQHTLEAQFECCISFAT